YKCAYNAYNLSCTPDPNKTLQWSDSETNVFQQCPDELRKIGRYKNLTNAAVLNHFIDCCNTSRVGERANFEFTTSDHLCRLIIFDNDFTTENLSKCTALQICQEYNGLIALSDIKQKAEQALRNERSSDSKTLKSFITVLGNIDPNAEGVKPILLFVFAKLTNQLQIISEFVPRFIPHIVASSLYSLNEKEGLNLLTDTHLIWLMQQQEYVLKIRESQLDISHFKRWAQLVADESIDSTLTISEAWLSFASAQRGKGRGTLLRADVDLLRKNTNMVPAKHHQLIPCENSCRTGLIKTPVGIIAPEYYRLHRLDRVGTSAGKCDLCDTLLFDFIYDNPETSTAKQTYIAHCVQHEMDVCDQCIPLTVYNPKQPSAQFKLASGNTLKQVLYEQDAHINKLEQDKVDSTQLYQWLTARNIHTNEYFELDVMWSFFADRYPQMIPRAIDELTKAIAPRVSPAIVYRQRSEHLSLPTPINLTNSNPRTLLGLKDLSLQTTHQHEHQINDVTSVLPVKATPVLGCPICTEPFDEDSIIMSTNCGHLFCEPCITDHIKYKESVKQLCECPICREKIEKITKSYSSFVKK
ncbi:MAG: hypothetical protein HAW66_09845, partial [Shewanella sp.]|nr:hypothetical protein [Shewanella sp.]